MPANTPLRKKSFWDRLLSKVPITTQKSCPTETQWIVRVLDILKHLQIFGVVTVYNTPCFVLSNRLHLGHIRNGTVTFR